MGSNRIDTNTLIHLYRGELGRMTTYRVRLDTTSNWALGVSIAITTFALGHQSVPHVLIALPVVLTLVFALLEARRMQDLELIRYRVRLLEQGFFATSLGCPEPTSWVLPLAGSISRRLGRAPRREPHVPPLTARAARRVDRPDPP